jgi:hypothetical protein
MRNITVTVSDRVYTHARTWAAQHDTSLSAVVQYMLSTIRTDWRGKAFLAARRDNPNDRKPLCPTFPAESALTSADVTSAASAEIPLHLKKTSIFEK